MMHHFGINYFNLDISKSFLKEIYEFNEKDTNDITPAENEIFIQSMSGYKAEFDFTNLDTIQTKCIGKAINRVIIDFEAFENALFISSTERFFLEEKTNSTNETLGVGTLIEIPSTLPFKSGITSLRDFVAPVVVGIIELGALLALLKSL